MSRDVVIIDYGSGNVRSMLNALTVAAHPDQRIFISADPEAIRAADRVVLPGVGAFAECRRKLDASGVLPALGDVVAKGRPFLGVCVGMQILATEGREFESSQGLGWIGGVVDALRFDASYPGPRKLPHVGWAPIKVRASPLFEGLNEGDYFYFVHSYVLRCDDPSDVVAEAEYGERFTAAVQRGNIFGCQFHPEKSDRAGLKLLRNFCSWET